VQGADQKSQKLSFELLLVATGRGPVTEGLGAEQLGIKMDRGYIVVDPLFKTNVPNYLATFWVSPEVWQRLWFAGRFARVTETDEFDSRGWRKAVVGFDVEEMACEYAVSFGPYLEVIEPASLREKVITMAQATLEFYRH